MPDANPTDSRHRPMQPLVRDEHGEIRFKANPIVEFLLDGGPFDMTRLSIMPFDNEVRAHFAQLLGCTVSSWVDLPYVSAEMVADVRRAEERRFGNSERQGAAAAIEQLRSQISDLQSAVDRMEDWLKEAAKL